MKESRPQSTPFQILRKTYVRRLERALFVSLVVAVVGLFAARYIVISKQQPVAPVFEIIVEDIPRTQQGVRRPPPPKPAIPVPSEDEAIPDDATIEPTTLDLQMALSTGPGNASPGDAIVAQARPIAFVFPQFPDEERNKGIRGTVRVSIQIDEHGQVVDAVIIDNTTKSELCGRTAIKAARATKFVPAHNRMGPTISWLVLPYTFKDSN